MTLLSTSFPLPHGKAEFVCVENRNRVRSHALPHSIGAAACSTQHSRRMQPGARPLTVYLDLCRMQLPGSQRPAWMTLAVHEASNWILAWSIANDRMLPCVMENMIAATERQPALRSRIEYVVDCVAALSACMRSALRGSRVTVAPVGRRTAAERVASSLVRSHQKAVMGGLGSAHEQNPDCVSTSRLRDHEGALAELVRSHNRQCLVTWSGGLSLRLQVEESRRFGRPRHH